MSDDGMVMCTECDNGSGRWFDAGGFCSRHCKDCNGTGRRPKPAPKATTDNVLAYLLGRFGLTREQADKDYLESEKAK